MTPLTDTWGGRLKQHDELALSILEKELNKHQIVLIRDGYETNNELKAHLLQYIDPTSKFIRARPDLIGVVSYKKTCNFMLELKSGDLRYPNFSVEADAFNNSRKYATQHDDVLAVTAFVDISTKDCKAAWTLDIKPWKIRVPNRPSDGVQNYKRMKSLFDNVEMCDYRGGSGTPYFLVPKNAKYLKPLSLFIKDDLLTVQDTLDVRDENRQSAQKTTLSDFFQLGMVVWCYFKRGSP